MKKYDYIKRVLDIILSISGLIIFFPMMVIIGIIIKTTSKGSIFFIQERIGKNGEKIKIYKFRTMIINAQELINNFSEEEKKEYEEKFKLLNEYRTTKFGKNLRRTSIDELPQLFNVLKGEMSLIGPRPVVEKEIAKYKENKQKLLSVKPGITGYWAANGRSKTTYDERIKMELYYVDNYCFKLDIKIILKTVVSVLKREGAI